MLSSDASGLGVRSHWRGFSQLASPHCVQRRGRSGLRGCHSLPQRTQVNLGRRILDGISSVMYTTSRISSNILRLPCNEMQGVYRQLAGKVVKKSRRLPVYLEPDEMER